MGRLGMWEREQTPQGRHNMGVERHRQHRVDGFLQEQNKRHDLE